MIYTVVYPEIRVRGIKRGKCKCGKVRTRREKFYQTLSEFNIDKKTGLLKTTDQILVEIKAERAAWEKEPITCKNCESK